MSRLNLLPGSCLGSHPKGPRTLEILGWNRTEGSLHQTPESLVPTESGTCTLYPREGLSEEGAGSRFSLCSDVAKLLPTTGESPLQAQQLCGNNKPEVVTGSEIRAGSGAWFLPRREASGGRSWS